MDKDTRDVYPLYLRAWRSARACEMYVGSEPSDSAGQLALALGAVDGRASNRVGGNDKFKTREQVLVEIAHHDSAPLRRVVDRFSSRIRRRRGA